LNSIIRKRDLGPNASIDGSLVNELYRTNPFNGSPDSAIILRMLIAAQAIGAAIRFE